MDIPIIQWHGNRKIAPKIIAKTAIKHETGSSTYFVLVLLKL